MRLRYTILILTYGISLIDTSVELRLPFGPTLHILYQTIKKKSVIKRHHQKYVNDKYAPAWKTIEFMTFGNIESLYVNLNNLSDKLEICRHFGVNQTAIFENYIKTIRILRNTCAHGGILFDLKLPQSVKNGPAGHFPRLSSNNLSCTLQIVDFFIRTISINRQNEMRSLIYNARSKLYKQNILLEDTLKKTAGVLQYQK